MAMVALSVTPIGTGSTSVGEYVAEAIRVVERSGFPYERNAMHPVVEGNLEAILQLIPAIHEACFARGARRVSTVVKIDDRRDAPASIAEKVRSVRARLDPAR